MAQDDFQVANGNGAAVRADINANFEAIATCSSGPTAPGTTYPYQWWADTNAGLLKQRNGANTGWVTVGAWDGTNWIPYRAGIPLGTAGTKSAETVLKSSDYTVVAADDGKTIRVDATAGSVTITLPPVATAGNGFRITILKTDVSDNRVTIDGDGVETIDDASAIALVKRHDSLDLVCDGGGWRVAASNLQRNRIVTIDTTNRSTTSATLVASGVRAALQTRRGDSKVRIRAEGIIGASTAAIVTLTLKGADGAIDLTPPGVNGLMHVRVSDDATVVPFAFETEHDPTNNPGDYEIHWRVSGGTAYLGRRGADATIDAPTILVLEELGP